MMSVLDTYRRAARYQPLSPTQRAGLRMWSTFWQTALAAGIVAVVWAAATGQQTLPFVALGQVGVIGLAAALVSGLVKLVRSQGEPTLAAPGAGASVLAGSSVQRRLSDIHATPSRAASASSAGRAGFSGPLTTRMGSGGHFPPLMPDDRRIRTDMLRRAAVTSAATRPVERVTPAISLQQSAARAPVAPQMDVATTEQRAVSKPANETSDENGPPTIQLPAINAVTAAKEDSWAR